MFAIRVAMLALLAVVACASLAHAANEPLQDLQDIENNEVLPENDVVRARVDEIPATTAAPPSSSPIAEDDAPTALPTEGADKDDVPAATTEAPKPASKPPSSLGQFLSEIIQFPIAVLRTVGSLLSNTFSGDRRTATATTTALPIDN